LGDSSKQEEELEGGDASVVTEGSAMDSSADGDQVDEEDQLAKRSQEEAEQEAASLGSARYVHAAFFGAGILAAYLGGKLLLAAWNTLADWPEAVRRVPQLIQYGEDERGTLTLIGGAVFGLLLVLWYYR